ncbi:MAG: hypothetical protein AAFR54_03305 [Planctomycetota bacterium]
MKSTPLSRLTLVAAGASSDTAARLAARIAVRAGDAGLGAVAVIVGADRDAPSTDAVEALERATGRSVHRVDVTLVPAPELQRLAVTVAGGLDLLLVVSGDTLEPGGAIGAGSLEAADSLGCPLVLVVDGEGPPGATVTDDAAFAAGTAARALSAERARFVTLTERPGPRRAELVARATGLEVVEVGASDAPLGEAALARLLDAARRCTALPPPPRHRRRHVRARVGLVLDRCFDLYDEDGLVHFEAAGAELVPLSALEGDGLPGPHDLDALDGLVIGDGRVERHSAALAARSTFREAVRAAIERGTPTLAAGGGLAYLGRGLRTITGTLHPFVGALDAEAVVSAEPLPGGHVEVECTRDTIVGPAGTRVSGYVQRSWRMRGLPTAERDAYRVVRGVRDGGAARANLFGLHMRPYWPSSPRAGTHFVDRCVAYAVARDRAACSSGDEPPR